jgi:hypothetical protein
MMIVDGSTGLDPISAGPMFGALFSTRPERIGRGASD